jgi:hypothetical protein
MTDSGNHQNQVDGQESLSTADWAERRLGQIRTALLGEELTDIELRLKAAQDAIAETMQAFEARAVDLDRQMADLELKLQTQADKATPRNDLAALLRSVADKLENGEA